MTDFLHFAVFGPLTFRGTAPEELPRTRAVTHELLAYLLINDGRAAGADVADALFPQMPSRRADERLRISAYELRRTSPRWARRRPRICSTAAGSTASTTI